ncbi:MAG: dehydrogenase [Actinobacteria bacterium]|jgi:multicomponent Na+:H+ antiporter subunit C|nr:MAG: dehydrogenase [Actinomycetota bacterium]
MSYLPYAVAGWIFLVGLYGIVTSRNLIHLIVCVSVVQSSTYVLLLTIGYKEHGTAPIFKDLPLAESQRAVDPVVQALTLTDIVVGVTVLALLLALALDAHRATGTLDPDELRALKG